MLNNSPCQAITSLLDAVKSGNEEIVKFFLKANVGINLFDVTGRNPLHYAACVKNINIAHILICAGVNMNQKDCNGDTPLIYAVRYRKPKLVALLLISGADKYVKNNSNLDAFYFACMYGYGEITKIFIGFKLNLNVLLDDKHTYLMTAIKNRSIKTINFLCSIGVDLDFVSNEMNNALFIARHDREIFDLLIMKGADINFKYADGWTLLMFSCYYKEKKVIETILQYNETDVNLTNDNKIDALSVAVYRGDIDTVKILVEHGSLYDKVNKLEKFMKNEEQQKCFDFLNNYRTEQKKIDSKNILEYYY